MRRFLLLLFAIAIVFCYSNASLASQDLEAKLTSLEQKVSKKFSRTFCNTTGFGISNEGALKFAIGETKSEFSQNPLMEEIDIDSLKDNILIDIADSCNFFELTKNDLEQLTIK